MVVAFALAAMLSSPPAAAQPVIVPFARPVTAVVDGVVSPGEYASTFTDTVTGIAVSWVHDDVNLSVGLVSPGTGWAGIGFGPEGILMDGSNIIIGYVLGAATVISDEYGVGLNHIADIGLGGRDDLLELAASEASGKTTLEFRIPLDSGDAYDIALRTGKTFSLLLAYHDTADDLITLHTAASAGSFILERDPNKIPTRRASLGLEGLGEPREAANVTLVARLLGDDGLPLASAVIDFFVNTSVGGGFLGATETDAQGAAQLNYTFLSPGPFRFVARFEGDLEYVPAEANTTFVAARSTEPSGLSTSDLAIRGMIFATLAGVASVYAFVVVQILLIRRTGVAPRRTGGRRIGRKANRG
jgi:hypothetical protein